MSFPRIKREAKHLKVKRGALSYLHDLAEAVLDVGGKGESDIGCEVGDPNALRDDLDCLLWNDAHRIPAASLLVLVPRELS